MGLLQVSHATMRRALRTAPLRNAPRRALATHEPQVSWSEYRAGTKTLAEWVEANRHVVAGGMFAFYVSLAVWNLRPGKKKAPAPVPEPATEAVKEAPTGA